MFNYIYTPFISFDVWHPYYKNMHAPDVNFTPTFSTLTTLNAWRMRFKQSDGTLLIFQQQNFLAIDEVLDLYFTMQVRTDLLNITDLFGTGRYWFSNLKADGTYQQDLTLTADNARPDIVPQQKMLNFTPGTVNSITLKNANGAFVSTTPVDAKSGSVKIVVQRPGLYSVIQNLTAGGTTEQKMIFSDELFQQPNVWAILHLQIKPGDTHLPFTLTLGNRNSRWQYYLVESMNRGGSTVNVAGLTINYSTTSDSRYPSTLAITQKAPADYTPAQQAYVDGLKTGGTVKEVYVYESQADMQILDGEPPVIKLEGDGGTTVGNIAVPDRSMKNTIIIYKL
jgi:hypothetical protein